MMIETSTGATQTATVHNQTHFEPSDYVVEDYLDNRRPVYDGGTVEEYRQEIEQWVLEMVRTFGADWPRKIHHCVHCGNGTVRWITAVRHTPTGDVVVFGSDCTDRLGFANRHAFKLAQLQARSEARKVRFTIYTKRTAFLGATPAIAEALAQISDPIHAGNHFAHDVLYKLDRYGSLSDAQVNAVVASMARDRDYAAKKALEATEVKGPAPSGRTIVTGLVLSIKQQENNFGVVTKMLVKLDSNAKVYVTAPSGIERGDTVTVRATWTPSHDDASFAFGSRPHLISRTPATV